MSVRKIYGKDQIRYLRCQICQKEFSERKNTALWNTKIREEKAISIGEHLAEGCSLKSTERLTKVSRDAIRRLRNKLGEHGKLFHDERVVDVEIETVQADERHGFAVNKHTQMWEGETLEPNSRFILSHVQGKREEEMMRTLFEDTKQRIAPANQQKIALFTDGLRSYATVFPEIFGTPYQPPRNGKRGRKPLPRYRIPRQLAHVQIVKHQSGRRLESVEVRYAHGSKKRIDEALESLGFTVPNTSYIERRNGTARSMNSSQVRKTLAFSKDKEGKRWLGWWTTTVYNWCRENRSLQLPLDNPIGRKLYQKRSPAMVIGLANSIFKVSEIIRTPVYPRRGMR